MIAVGDLAASLRLRRKVNPPHGRARVAWNTWKGNDDSTTGSKRVAANAITSRSRSLVKHHIYVGRGGIENKITDYQIGLSVAVKTSRHHRHDKCTGGKERP